MIDPGATHPGHVEPLLYVVLLYRLRHRLLALPFVAAFAVVHREYMTAGVVALTLEICLYEPAR